MVRISYYGLTIYVSCLFHSGLFTPHDVHCMVEEILKMKEFSHPNVMGLLGVCLNPGAGVAIVMPYMGNGSLLSYLKKDKKALILPSSADAHTVE